MVESPKIDLRIFSKECSFVKGVLELKQLPKIFTAEDQPFKEIAFWGRSNVGKSSLINAFLNRKRLVKVSNTPGRTREINFFNLADTFFVVDLPGYGYAKISKDKKALWNEVVVAYLNKSINLQRVYLLIDGKVGFKDIDFEIMDFMNYIGKSYQIVFTKIDKSNKGNIAKLSESVKAIIEKNPACFPECIFTSSKERFGLDELKKSIITLIS